MEEVESVRQSLTTGEAFKNKLEKIIADGPDELQIVADFDRTITHAFRPDGAVNTSLSTLWLFMPQEYARRAKVLFDRYRPIEMDLTLSKEEKFEHMKTWIRAWQQNCMELGFNKEVVRKLVNSGLLAARDGFDDFMKLANGRKVPTLIFSAGLGDVIEESLEQKGLNAPNVHVISNFARFDAEGNCVGWNEDVVTSVSKDESHTLHKNWTEALKRRRNVILLGDHAADIHMADGQQHETVLSIGFLNGEQNYLESHSKVFDAVIMEDGDFSVPTDILRKVVQPAR